MDHTTAHADARQAEVINSGEELLLKARATARRIEERVWRVLVRHGTPVAHPRGPALGDEPPPPGR